MKKKQTGGEAGIRDPYQNKHVRRKSTFAVLLAVIVVVTFTAIVGYVRLKMTNDQLYDTNRIRIGTVIGGLEAGLTENDELYKEYDQLYVSKLLTTHFYYGNYWDLQLNDNFAREVAEYAKVDSVAIIDREGNTCGAWQCDYDFTRKRFNMLRTNIREDGTTEPFSVEYEDGVRRFYGMELMADRILVFVQDWTAVENNIRDMTSWEAVLRGMVSVDTKSIAVSLKDYTFLYNPIGDLTGRDALQNGVPIECLTGDGFEQQLIIGGQRWAAVGKKWKDAMVIVLTRADTNLVNDLMLIFFIGITFAMFAGLTAVYGVIINRDNIRMGRMPEFIPLLSERLNFNWSVSEKLFPVAALGILAAGGLTFYMQSINSLSSIANESNWTINEIHNKLADNLEDAERLNTEYKEQFSQKCSLLADMLEEHPNYVFSFNREDEKVHKQPVEKNDEGKVISGLDSYGNECYSISRHPFLQKLCDINAIEKFSLYDEYGRIMATNDNDWYFVLSDNPESQSYQFWEILAGHMDFVAQDLRLSDKGEYSQYIGTVFYYYTVRNEDGSTGYVSRGAYRKQMDGLWDGSPIEKHRGLLQISIAPERLRTVMETATLTYVADHTTVHGTGFVVICDTGDDHVCIYSPRSGDIGKTAASLGYSDNAFNASGEMYNGYETVDGENCFQTFKLADNYYIGTSVPMSTVYANRGRIGLIAFISAAAGLLMIFLYTCLFGRKEEQMYREFAAEAEQRRARNEQDTILLTMPSGKTRKSRTAASRWDAVYIPWGQKTPEQKFASIANVVFHIFAIFLFLCIVGSRSKLFTIDAVDYVFEGVWSRGVNIFAMTNCVITLIIVIVAANIAGVIVDDVCANIGSRAETLGHLFASVVRYGVALFSLFYTLYLCGLDTGSLIASAGILSLVIGLGAQSMIQDILAGVFIVFEGAFRVGDIVTIGDFRGNVVDIGLRTTKIQDISKNIKIFNNSDLSGIINMTKEASFAEIDVGIEYGESIERVEAVLERELKNIKKRLPDIIDGPYYQGVSALSDSSVVLKIIAMCKEADRIQLCRDLNREILLIFNKNDINIPFPQVTCSFLSDGAEVSAEKERRAARRFAEEQKEKSREINVEDKVDG